MGIVIINMCMSTAIAVLMMTAFTTSHVSAFTIDPSVEVMSIPKDNVERTHIGGPLSQDPCPDGSEAISQDMRLFASLPEGVSKITIQREDDLYRTRDVYCWRHW